MKKVAVLLVLSMLLLVPAAGAYDYKDWVPLLPESMGGLVPSGEADGVNMDMNGQKWSSVNQEYAAGDGQKTAQLSVVAGLMAPQVQGFQAMAAMNMNMETNEQVMKTVTVSGKKSVLTLDRQSRSGTLMVPLRPDMILVLTLEPAASESELTSLAQQIPIAAFADAK